MCKTTLTDALSLIERAKTSIASNADNKSYCEALDNLLEGFKQQLIDDFTDIPITFFDEKSEKESGKKSGKKSVTIHNRELTSKASMLYDDIDTSI